MDTNKNTLYSIIAILSIILFFTWCNNSQSDIDEAVATAVAKALATPTAVPIPTATELPIYIWTPATAAKRGEQYTWGNVPKVIISPHWRLVVKVVRVIDGDTIVVDPISDEDKLKFQRAGSYWGFQQESDGSAIMIDAPKGTVVRYIGIDTPETVHPDKPVQCYGPEATLRNKQLVEGETVTLMRINGGDFKDSFDRYGRLLANVYTDTHWVNGELVWGGFAYDYKGLSGAWSAHESIYQEWETDAKNNKRGLWGKC